MTLAPQKRHRRTKAAINALEVAIYITLEADHPQTLRGLFYQLESQGLIPKTDQAYKTIGRLCVQMRKAGVLPYEWLADSTRWMRKPTSHSGLEEALRLTAQTYRRALWHNQDAYVEIWLEKDALSGVLYETTAEWDVPLMVTRGYPSLSYLFEAAEAIKRKRKPTYLYYFGDYDPSGVNIPVKVEAELRRMAPKAEIYFSRVAVTEDQIRRWSLPTRPTKTTDSRARTFGNRSVEVDAIPAKTLRNIAQRCITNHIADMSQIRVLQVAEESERSVLYQLAAEAGAM
jgi:hypothetical protein